MDSHRRALRESNSFRAVVRQMLSEGTSVAKIMKATGKSWLHVTQIVKQIKSEEAEQL